MDPIVTTGFRCLILFSGLEESRLKIIVTMMVLRYEYPRLYTRVCSKIASLWTNPLSREKFLPHFHPSPKN